MGLIYKPIKLTGTLGSKTLQEATSIAPPYNIPSPVTLRLGKGTTRVDEMMISYIDLDGHRVPWTFIMVPKLTE